MSAAPPIPARVLQQAAGWFASLRDPGAGETEREAWRCWLVAHPDHARAWARVEGVVADVAPLARGGDAAREALGRALPDTRRAALRQLAVLACVAGGGWAVWRGIDGVEPALQAAVQLRSGLNETRAFVLADDSRVWLGSLAELDVRYDDGLRRLELLRGDLLVQTAADTRRPPRPLVVDTRHGRLRALGTRFTVRLEAGQSRLEVHEGAVEITFAGALAPAATVAAGERAVFDGRAFTSRGRSAGDGDGWTRDLLIAHDRRLDEVLAELARWHGVPSDCDPSVAALRVVGVYPLKEPERALAALQAALPIVARRDAAGLHARAR